MARNGKKLSKEAPAVTRALAERGGSAAERGGLGIPVTVRPEPSDPAAQPLPTDRRLVGLELGRTGLTQYYGRLYEEFLPELRQEKGRKIFREMADNDPTIGALRSAIKLLVKSAKWRTESAHNKVDARADFVEQCRTDTEHTFEELVGEVVDDMIVFGFHYPEIVYKRRQSGDSQYKDNKIGWKKFATRSPESLYRWEFESDTQELRGMWQRPPPDFQLRYIPLEKALLFRMETLKNSPEGRSGLRNAYRPWYFKKYLEQLEAIGAERTAAGYPVMWIPAEMILKNDPLVDTFTKMAVNIRTDELMGMVMPLAYDEKGQKLYDFEFKSPAGGKQYDMSAIITRYDVRILMTVLVDFVIQGHDQTGSFAMAKTKIDFFNLALSGWLDAVAGPLNRYAIPRLLELNGMDTEDPPQFKHGDVQRRDLQQIGDYILKLSQAGMPIFPDPAIENVLREFGDLPTMPPEELQQRELQDQEEEALAAQEAAARSQAAIATNRATAANPEPKGITAPKEEPPKSNGKPEAKPEPAAKQDIHLHVHEGNVSVTPSPVTVEGAQITVSKDAPPVTQVTVEAAAPIVVPPAVVHVDGSQITVEASAPLVIPAPQVTVEKTVVAPEITVAAPQITVQAAAPVVVPAPLVTVEKTTVEVAAPQITVEAPVVTVEPPAVTIQNVIEKDQTPKQLIVQRDADGKFIGGTITPTSSGETS